MKYYYTVGSESRLIESKSKTIAGVKQELSNVDHCDVYGDVDACDFLPDVLAAKRDGKWVKV
jgi:nitrate reductase NapAB chaperone NapD